LLTRKFAMLRLALELELELELKRCLAPHWLSYLYR
jgi:hypothetical protein